MDTVLLFASFFLRDPRVVATFVAATSALTVGLYWRGLHHEQPRPLAALAAGASLGLIVAFTWPITSGLWSIHWNLNAVWEGLNPANGGFGAWSHGTDGPLNVLLYIPAGLAITTLIPTLRRTWAAPVALALLSLVTEIWQALDGGRTEQLSDIISNTIGALIGTTATVLFRLAYNTHISRQLHR